MLKFFENLEGTDESEEFDSLMDHIKLFPQCDEHFFSRFQVYATTNPT